MLKELNEMVEMFKGDRLVLIKINPSVYDKLLEDKTIQKVAKSMNPMTSVKVELDDSISNIEYVHASELEEEKL